MEKTLHPRYREFSIAVLLAFGLIVLQILIGGRRPLFAYSGYLVIGAVGIFAVLAWWPTRSHANPLCLLASVFLFGYMLARSLISDVPYFARPDFFCVLAALVAYGLCVTVLSGPTPRMIVLGLLIVFALGQVFIGLIQFSRADNFMLIGALQRTDYGQRASGFYVCPNHLAGLLEVIGVFGLSFALWSRWPLWAKLLAGYATAACFAGVALTASRGGYVSTMAGILAFLLLSVLASRFADRQTFFRYGIGGLVIAALAVALAGTLLFKSSYLHDRAGNIVDTKNVRLRLWEAAVQQWKLQPIVGTGGGTYLFYGRQFRAADMQNDPVDVHNDYLHLLAEYGVVGFAGFLLFFGAHVRRGVKSFRHFSRQKHARSSRPASNRLALNIGALCALATYTAHSVVDFNLHIPANALLMAFVLGMLANPGLHSMAEKKTTRFLSILPRLAVGGAALALLVQCARFYPGEYFAEKARTALRDELPPATTIAFAQKALTYDRRNPEVYFYLGRAELAFGDWETDAEARPAHLARAAENFLHAHAVAPLDGTYPLNAAYVLDRLGRFSEAENLYGIARGQDPRAIALAELYNFHLYQWRQKL
ncbi:MAG: O-antigen ligase family protein [Chthoniobacterales bacterium]